MVISQYPPAKRLRIAAEERVLTHHKFSSASEFSSSLYGSRDMNLYWYGIQSNALFFALHPTELTERLEEASKIYNQRQT